MTETKDMERAASLLRLAFNGGAADGEASNAFGALRAILQRSGLAVPDVAAIAFPGARPTGGLSWMGTDAIGQYGRGYVDGSRDAVETIGKLRDEVRTLQAELQLCRHQASPKGREEARRERWFTEIESRLWALLREDKELPGVEALAKRLGRRAKHVREVLRFLVADDCVQAIGRGRGRRYQINPSHDRDGKSETRPQPGTGKKSRPKRRTGNAGRKQ